MTSAVASLIFLTILTSLTVSICMPIHGWSNDSNDPVWRMVTGAKVSRDYFFGHSVEEPLVSIDSSRVKTILDGVCDLLVFREILSGLDNGSDIYLLLTQNVVDSCAWLNSLVTANVSVRVSNDFLRLPDTCAPNNTPRLHKYCLQLRAREPSQLLRPEDLSSNISDELSTHYSPAVTPAHQCQWLNTTDITNEAKNRIRELVK